VLFHAVVLRGPMPRHDIARCCGFLDNIWFPAAIAWKRAVMRSRIERALKFPN
jgi:hypothetical protein